MKEKHIPGRLQISTKCNQECLFCSVPEGPPEEPSLDEIKKRIDKLKELGTNDLFITGGEPMIHKDIFKILDYAKKTGFYEITIQSNASELTRPIVEKIKSYGNVKFNISFHSFEEELCNRLSGAEHYNKFMAAMAHIRDIGIPIFLTIVINKLNYKKLTDHIKFIRNNFPNVTHFSFNFIDPSGRARDNPWLIPTLLETEKYIHEVVSYILNNNLTFRLERVPLCYMNGFEKFSTEVRMPAFDEKRLTYFAQTGEKENLNIEEKSKYHKTEACNDCFLNQLCPGLNPNYVRIHGDKEIFPVFTNPNNIIHGMESTKTNLYTENNLKKDSFEKNVHDDLELFKKSIELKSNKNNIYDTYSFYLMKCIGFKDKAFIYNAWDIFLKKLKAGEEPNFLNLYFHFPYCQSNCDYCIYPSTELKDRQQIEDYIDYLIKDMKLFSPLFKGIKFKCLSIGGGTPSLMSESQLKRLLDNIFKYFEFDELGEKSIEFNPNTTTYEKLKVVDDFHFNKLSIGVQSLSPRVLKIIKRSYQREDKIRETITNFKKTNIGFMNVDLLLGLRGDTPEDFLYTYEEICKMQPNLICIYPLKANDKYIGARYGTTKKFLEFYYPLFDAVTKKIPEIAERQRYTHYDDPSKLSYVHPFAFGWKDQGRRDVKYLYSNFKVEPYSTLGLGYYAESCINNMIRYTCVDKEHPTTLFLKKFSTDKNDFTYSTHLFYPHYDKVKFIVHSVYEHFSVYREKYKKMYKGDIVDDFPYAIKALQYLKIITVTEKEIIFNVKDEKETYPYLLFFVGNEIVHEKTRT